jgi:polysaccharide chain length determinant protein (PEP-CTERM system associated)
MLPGRKYTPEDILSLLWKRRWYVIVPFVLCSMTALIVSRVLPNKYESETLIQVIPQRVPEEYVRSTVTTRLEDRLQSLTQLIMSRTRLEKVIQEFNLYPEARAKGIMQDVVEGMQKDITVKTTGDRNGVDAFTIKYTSSDRHLAQKVTERLAGLFIEENLRDRGFLADATNDFLGTQLLEARSRLEQQEARLKGFRERYSGRLPSQLESNMQAIQTTQMQLQALVESTARDRDRKLMLERLLGDARSEVEAMRTAALLPAATGPVAGGEDPLAGATATQRLEAARAMLAQAELRLKPEHPDIKRLKRVISDLEKKAEQEALQQPVSETAAAAAAPRPFSREEAEKRTRVRDMAAEIESLDRQIQFKESEERRLRASIAGYQARIEAVPGLESEWIALSRDYDTLQANYKQLLAKSEDSKVAANLERRQIGEQFRVLDAARVPERPVSPKRIQINGMGAALGLLIGFALIGLMEYKDSSFRTDVDVVNVLSLPVLAVVPQIVTRAEQRRAKRRNLMFSLAGTFAFVVIGGGLFWYLKLWNYLT